jgi:hypothetical protein
VGEKCLCWLPSLLLAEYKKIHVEWYEVHLWYTQIKNWCWNNNVCTQVLWSR